MIDRKTGKAVPGYLRNLKLAELSGCGRGANQHARVVLFKAADGSAVSKVYGKAEDLPEAIKTALPADAQAVFLRVANAELAKDAGDEQQAFKIAWAAVKNGWEKTAEGWTKKAGGDGDTGDEDDEDKKGKGGTNNKKPYPWMSAKNIEGVAKAFYGYASPVPDSGSRPGATSFDDLLAAREEERARSEVNEKLWPFFYALDESIRSVIADERVSRDAKIPLIRQSVEQFMAAMGETVPNAAEELSKLLESIPELSGCFDAGERTGDHSVPAAKELDMADDTKKVADLESQIAKLTKDLETATASITDLTKQVNDTKAAKETAEKALADVNKSIEVAKTDETMVIKDGDKDVTIRKSEVGDASWAMFKSQAARIEKAESERAEVVFTKRAQEEIGALPGEPTLKGKVLKAIEDIADKDVREATIAALKAGNAAMKSGFRPVGVDGGGNSGDDAASKLDKMAREHAATAKVSFEKAYDVVLQSDEGRRLYKESLGTPRAAA